MVNTIDVHTHGIGGFDTRTASHRQILRIAEIHKTLGVSEFIPTIYSDTIDTMREHIKPVQKAMAIQEQRGYENAGEAKILGVHLEGPFLNPKMCGALNKSSFLKPSSDSLTRLTEGYGDIVKIITIAPELEGAPSLIETAADRGIIVNMGHSNATYEEARNGFNAGARGITHIFNAMRGFHHREPGIAGFGMLDDDIYIEVIADPYHLDIKTISMIFMLKPADRIILVSDSIKYTNTSLAEEAVEDSNKVLQGGAIHITGAANRLIKLGFNEDTVMRSITVNPANYLQSIKTRG